MSAERTIVQVQARRLGVQLDEAATLARMAKHRVQVEVHRGAGRQQTGRRMRQDAEASVIHRAAQAAGLAIRRQAEAAVHGPDHAVETQSGPGQGSAFRVGLPLAGRDAAVAH